MNIKKHIDKYYKFNGYSVIISDDTIKNVIHIRYRKNNQEVLVYYDKDGSEHQISHYLLNYDRYETTCHGYFLQEQFALTEQTIKTSYCWKSIVLE